MSKDIESARVRKKVMMPLRVIQVVCAFYIIATLVLPMYDPSGFFRGFKYSIFCIIFVVIGVFGAMGYLKPAVPLLPFCVVRLVQFIASLFGDGSVALLKIPFIFNCILGVVLLSLMMIDRERFYYVEEDL